MLYTHTHTHTRGLWIPVVCIGAAPTPLLHLPFSNIVVKMWKRMSPRRSEAEEEESEGKCVLPNRVKEMRKNSSFVIHFLKRDTTERGVGRSVKNNKKAQGRHVLRRATRKAHLREGRVLLLFHLRFESMNIHTKPSISLFSVSPARTPLAMFALSLSLRVRHVAEDRDRKPPSFPSDIRHSLGAPPTPPLTVKIKTHLGT